MTIIEKIKKENEKLLKENKELKKKLEVAKNWMKKEIKENVKKISKNRVKKMDSEVKNIFIEENIEEVITKNITDFFWEILLLNIPSAVIENIISAEISYFNLKENKNTDGIWVITSYNKCLDILIEIFITKQFRKFVKKKSQIYLRKNDPIEKTLNLVVNSWYILWVWRLYHILTLIINEEILYDFWKCFREYLIKYDYISQILLKEDFYVNFKKLILSEVFGRKRHIWKITFEETKQARELLIWNFTNKKCIIYNLCEIWKIDY